MAIDVGLLEKITCIDILKTEGAHYKYLFYYKLLMTLSLVS